MSADTDHAIFVRQAYRYVEVLDNTVKARNPSARIVQIDTNMDSTSAIALASGYLNLLKQPRAFEITLDGRQSFSDFVNGPPSFIIDDTQSAPGTTARLQYSLNVDYENNTTVLQVIG